VNIKITGYLKHVISSVLITNSKPMILNRTIEHNLARVRQILTDPLSSGPAFQFSRRCFGNLAGMKQNLKGRIEERAARFLNSSESFPAYEEFVKKLTIDGITTVPEFYDSALIERISNRFESLVDDVTVTRNPPPDKMWNYRRDIDPADQVLPELFELVDERVSNILTGYYKSPFQINWCKIWRNLNVPREMTEQQEFFSSHWHNDSTKCSKISLFILLSDVTEDDGPMHVMTKPRTQFLIRKGFGQRDDYKIPSEVLEDPAHVIKFTGRAGTAIICSTAMCLHRASIPIQGHHRDMVRIDFLPSRISGSLDRLVTS